MKQMRIVLFFLAVISVSFSPGEDTKSKKGKWVSLFNGKDLNNWIPKIAGYKAGDNFGNTFRVHDGILSTRYDAYDSFRNRFGALFYDKKFSNYKLRVEYRFTGDTVPGAPSWGFRDGGIQYHCQSPSSMNVDQPFPVCLEYNLLGGNGKQQRPSGEICANGIYVEINGKRNASYCSPPIVKRTLSGDDWVMAEIDVQGGKIKHFINGEEVLEFDNPKYDSTNALAKKFITGRNDKVSEGYISLQSNSHPMDFRRIEIMEY
ncbi:MAG TPA: DUF1080 domain-containing protein [Parafilimonas sp.]|nr:DUF1080 domain-containing protein [Parafilimonas sp.]